MTNLLDYPALHGEPVTERHVKICAARGHARYTTGGIERDRCPRCGELLDLPTGTALLVASVVTDLLANAPSTRGLSSREIERLALDAARYFAEREQ